MLTSSSLFTNLKKLPSKQKHAIRIVHNKAKFEHTRHLFRKNKIFNLYRLNILNNVMFVHKIPTQTASSVFDPLIQRPSHSYPTNFSECSYSLPTHNLRKSKFRTSIRGPLLSNNFLTKTEKSIEKLSLFKSKVKNKLLVLENKAKYFE